MLTFCWIIWYNTFAMKLTKDFAYMELQKIMKEKVLLVVGTGASMALDPRFGMGALRDELCNKIPDKISHDRDAVDQWEKVLYVLNNNGDLESALNEVKNKILISTVIRVTGDFVAGLEIEYKSKILNGNIEIPIGHFLQKLSDGLPEYDPVLDIITPNYDLLLEYCCDTHEIPYITGFWGGIQKQYNWEESIQQMIHTKDIPRGKRILKIERTRRHIRIHKVHGSLNWFKKGDKIFEDNTLVYTRQDEASTIERFIITPGKSKYEKAFLSNFNLFANANQAVSGERGFIFVGYGFNDDHIQQNIKKEIIEKKKAGIIITKELTRKADDLLKKSNNLWAVYQKRKDEDDKKGTSTYIYNQAYDKPLIIENSNIWNIKCFSREVLGD